MIKSIYKKWPYFLLAIVLLTISISLDGLITIKIMEIIDAALDRNMDLLKDQVLVAIYIVILLLPINLLVSYTRGLFLLKTLVNSKFTYVKGVFKKNINEFQLENNANYISAMTNDMNNIERRYLEGIYEVGASIISFIVAFLVIALVSPVALFAGIGIIIFSGLTTMLVGRPLKKHEKQRSGLFQGYTSYIKEVLGAFQIIKANNLNEKVKKDFYNKSRDIQYKGYTIDKISTYISGGQTLIMNSSTLGILAVSVYLAIKGNITPGAVILIVNNISRVIYPLMNLSEWLPKIISAKALFDKMDKSLENQHKYEETVELEAFNKRIVFEDLSFSYDDREILKDVNLTIRKGEKYLIVGPSGGGKSTLLRLFRKYFNPSKGKILIDNYNLKDIKKETYFNFISNVEQEVFLFEDTIRNNISLYKDYGEEEILLAIKKAGLEDFISKLAKGLDTVIYDNGKNISGGEKSRIAIARGLLRKADIIFLDEAFASLDAKVAKEIENTLLSLEGITLINVSHVVFEESKGAYDKIFLVKNKSVLNSKG